MRAALSASENVDKIVLGRKSCRKHYRAYRPVLDHIQYMRRIKTVCLNGSISSRYLDVKEKSLVKIFAYRHKPSDLVKESFDIRRCRRFRILLKPRLGARLKALKLRDEICGQGGIKIKASLLSVCRPYKVVAAKTLQSPQSHYDLLKAIVYILVRKVYTGVYPLKIRAPERCGIHISRSVRKVMRLVQKEDILALLCRVGKISSEIYHRVKDVVIVADYYIAILRKIER